MSKMSAFRVHTSNLDVREKMYYVRPTFIEEFLNFFRTMVLTFWRQTSVELDRSCVLVVMDVIEAYAPLYSDKCLDEITKAIDEARQKQCKIIFTRWVRCRKEDDLATLDDPDAPHVQKKLDAIKELKQKLRDLADDEHNGDKHNIDLEELLAHCEDADKEFLAKMEDPADCQHSLQRASDEIDKKGHWTFFVPDGATDLLIEPGEGDIVVDVWHTNAFMHTNFCKHIDPNDTLVFTGGWGESCIINTVRNAVDRNMKTMVIKNACAGHTGIFQYAMFVLQSVYTTVYSTIAT